MDIEQVRNQIVEMKENIIRKKLRQEDIRKLSLTTQEKLCLIDWHDQGIMRLEASIDRMEREWHITKH
jgi:hypothetical protein